MRIEQKHYTPEEKAVSLRRHDIEWLPVPILCDNHHSLWYRSGLSKSMKWMYDPAAEESENVTPH